MLSGCPGAAMLRGAPSIKIKICPECGREIEIFSIDTHIVCECGFIAYNDTQSCIQWCAYARECVGDTIYNAFMESKIS
ncbi:MAG: hypothetical protein LBH09_05675 [Peptococcaceae bacterium]|jgi:hypothetical protein|nr:hypothetical protein [Peptococcaceae bacterium]